MRQINADEIDKMLSKVFEVFPKKEPPDAANIAVDEIGDSPELRRSFTGERWWLMPKEVLLKHFDDLPLLTPEAFHYFFPAFLLCSLNNFDRDNEILQSTIFTLSPTKTASNSPRIRERQAHFSRDQIAIIRRFLQAVLAEESMYNFYEPAARALRKFWTEENP